MFKLAGHLGMTVAQLKSSLDADELAHWMAYDQLDPIGGYRLDANFAMLADLTAKAAGVTDSKMSDYLIVDPDPISDEERERREQVAERERIKAKGEQLKNQIAKMLEKQSSNKAIE